MTFFAVLFNLKLSQIRLLKELEIGQYLKRIKSDTSEWVEYTKVTRECG